MMNDSTTSDRILDRDELEEAAEYGGRRRLGTLGMKLINKYLEHSIEADRYDDLLDVLEAPSPLDKFRYFRETYRWPRDIDAERDRCRRLRDQHEENANRFDKARDELDEFKEEQFA